MNLLNSHCIHLRLLSIFVISIFSLRQVMADEKRLSAEAMFITEAEWDLKDHAAWMNEAVLYGTWKPAHHSSFELASLHTYGIGTNMIVDDLQGFSNIKNENLAIGLNILDYAFETTLGTDSTHNLQLYTGIRNVNEDYFATGCNTLFLNSSNGIFPTIGANFPIANFPLAGLCPIHISYEHSCGINAKFSIYNGLGGKLTDGTVFRFRPKKDGITTMSEISYKDEDSPYYKLYAAGIATNNSPIGVEEGNYSKKHRAVWWALMEQGLFWSENFNINILLQGSTTLTGDDICSNYFGAGLTLGLDESERTIRLQSVGLMAQHATFEVGREWSEELILKVGLFDRFSFKPSFQLIERDQKLQTAAIVRFCYETK